MKVGFLICFFSSSCGRLFIFGALNEHDTLTHGDVQRQESDLVGLPIEFLCGMPSDTCQPHKIMLPLRKMSSGPARNFKQRHPQAYSRVPFVLAYHLHVAHAYSRSENLVISSVPTLPGWTQVGRSNVWICHWLRHFTVCLSTSIACLIIAGVGTSQRIGEFVVNVNALPI